MRVCLYMLKWQCAVQSNTLYSDMQGQFAPLPAWGTRVNVKTPRGYSEATYSKNSTKKLKATEYFQKL